MSTEPRHSKYCRQSVDEQSDSIVQQRSGLLQHPRALRAWTQLLLPAWAVNGTCPQVYSSGHGCALVKIWSDSKRMVVAQCVGFVFAQTFSSLTVILEPNISDRT